RSNTQKTTIDLVGWLPLDLPTSKPNKSAEPRLDLPCLRPVVRGDEPNKPVSRTRLTLLPEPGLALQAQRQLDPLTRQRSPGSRARDRPARGRRSMARRTLPTAAPSSSGRGRRRARRSAPRRPAAAGN